MRTMGTSPFARSRRARTCIASRAAKRMASECACTRRGAESSSSSASPSGEMASATSRSEGGSSAAGGGRRNRVATKAPRGICDSSRRSLKNTTSWMLIGAGLVASTNDTSGERSAASTIFARSRKPPKRSFSSVMNSAIASRKPPPVMRPNPRSTTTADRASKLSDSLPVDWNAWTNQRIAAESSASTSRSGASRKSSALVVGGVSRMTKSKRGSFCTATSFSIAMYSCVPASDRETYWYSLLLKSLLARSGDGEYLRTSSSKVALGSSIIAVSEPRAAPSETNGSDTSCSSPIMRPSPSAWARRFAGSMVKQSPRRPRRAAPTPSAAAVVVLPTPPAPTTTSTRRDITSWSSVSGMAVVLAVREVVEARVGRVEADADGVGRAVSLLGDDELGDVPIGRFLVVVVVAVDKADVVGVLLDRPRLAKVGELRPLALLPARFDRAIELTEGDDRQAELLGELLEPSRYLADLLLARRLPVAPLHELKVVDDHEPDAPLLFAAGRVDVIELRLESARLRPKLQDRQRGRVVDPDVEARQMRRRLRQFAPVAGRQHSGAHAAHVDLRLRAEHAVTDLLSRHLEREDHDPGARLLPALVRVACALELLRARDIRCDVEDEARFAHPRASRDNRQLAVVEAARDAVVPVEAGRDSRNACAACVRLVDALERLAHHFLERANAVRLARSRDVVDCLLGRIDELLGVPVAGVALCGDALAREDELANTPLLVNGPAVGCDVGDRRRRVEDFGQVRDASDLSQPVAVPQPGRHLHDIDRLALGGALDTSLEDASVRLRVEVLGLEKLAHLVEGERIEHHGGQDGRLDPQVVRWNPLVERDRVLRFPPNHSKFFHSPHPKMHCASAENGQGA